MATCKECLHFDVCYMVEHYGVDIEEDRQEYDCHQFKDKANYEEVKHGRWIWKDFWHNGSYALCCSECLETEGARETANYCPNCGARMDLEGKK